MNSISIDPRVNRMEEPSQTVIISAEDGWHTWEVFHQKKTGAQHTHAGIVHAPNPEMALMLAKEGFGRRGATTSIWVVPSSEIFATDSEDADMFATTPEKIHREAIAYKTRDKIQQHPSADEHE